MLYGQLEVGGCYPARVAVLADERQTHGTDSDHHSTLSAVRRRVWILPRRLLPSRRTHRDRRHTRPDPRRPRDRLAGARAHRRRLFISPEKPRLVLGQSGGSATAVPQYSIRRSTMDKDRIEGSARQVIGSIKEVVGKVLGDQ